ncbi:hypothetical protein BOTNAR_0372g00050 [Botryotinia narcissicola]|uniref:Uncharacterized protein n=1 Tax=Botryotinia narcissicola TaxID=278944 RepID=A0A4Z1HQA3_9HELO|nr:hypothetical protein BOTNAR_0372g00050 [Botryotinia narcissicola]
MCLLAYTYRLVLRGAGDHEARGANKQDDLSEEKSRIIIKSEKGVVGLNPYRLLTRDPCIAWSLASGGLDRITIGAER